VADSKKAPPRKTLDMNAFNPNQESNKKAIYKKIPLGELEHNPINDELYGDEPELVNDEINEMVIKIRERGLFQPLVVKRHPSQAGRYEIISGHTRFEALKILGETEVDCKVIKVETEVDQILSEIDVIATNQNKKHSTLRKAKEVKRLEDLAAQLKEVSGDIPNVNEFIASLIGVGKRQVIRLKKIADAPDEVKEEIAAGNMTISEAEKIVPKTETQQKQSAAAKEKAKEKADNEEKEINYEKQAMKIYAMSADIENAKKEGKTIDAKTKGIVKDSISKLQSIIED